MVNTILAKRVNHIVAKGGNPVWPKGSKSRGFSSTIENCHVIGGSVMDSGNISGGIAGNNYGTIRACSSSAEVIYTVISTDNKIAGGIVGANLGSVLACYATGSVNVYPEPGNVKGAIAGQNDINNGTITACYWSGDEEKGVGGGLDTTTKVDGEVVTWENAMATMNTALDGTGYQWVENPDDKTGKRPLIITNE